MCLLLQRPPQLHWSASLTRPEFLKIRNIILLTLVTPKCIGHSRCSKMLNGWMVWNRLEEHGISPHTKTEHSQGSKSQIQQVAAQRCSEEIRLLKSNRQTWAWPLALPLTPWTWLHLFSPHTHLPPPYHLKPHCCPLGQRKEWKGKSKIKPNKIFI